MITKTKAKQNEVSVVILEELVPEDHLLRKIDRVLDFSFIYAYVEDQYGKTGRPSIDPVVLIKLAFIDKLYGYHSMRRTCAEAQVNLAIKWFLGYGLEEKTPHFSDFSKTYTRKWKKQIEVINAQGEKEEKSIFAILFEEVLSQAMKRNYLQPSHSYMDSTHIKANANKKQVREAVAAAERRSYQEELDREIDEECERQGIKKPKELKEEEKTRKMSKNDEEAGIFLKGEHELQVAYLAQTVCDEHGFVLNTKIVPANMHDSTTFHEVYRATVKRYGVGGKKGIRSLAVDAGYKTPAVAREIIQSGVTPLMPYARPKGKRNNEETAVKMGKKNFRYDKAANVFQGPNQCILRPRGINRKTGYITYRSRKAECDQCRKRGECLSKSASVKTVNRHLWQKNLEEAEQIRLSGYWSEYYPKRSQTIERVFADAKEKHGMRFTRYKGKQKVEDETLLIFACMNLKKIALWEAKAA